jgi:predicted acylesterase/phospholipase RssA
MPKDSRPTEDLRRSVADVYAAELDYLVERRRRLGDKDVDASSLQAERQRAGTAIAPRVAHGTVGLALSGGGIRSATFSLGVLQALA